MASNTVHLDTSFLIGALRPGSDADAAVRAWLADGKRLAMSAVAWTEFLCGPVDAEIAEMAARVVSERVAFDERDAAAAARLFNETGRRRGSLVDCMIAATASRLDAELATLDRDDFARFEATGLRLAHP